MEAGTKTQIRAEMVVVVVVVVVEVSTRWLWSIVAEYGRLFVVAAAHCSIVKTRVVVGHSARRAESIWAGVGV